MDYDFEKNYFLENGPDWNDYGEEREEEYYDAYYQCKDEMYGELMIRFKDCVEGRM